MKINKNIFYRNVTILVLLGTVLVQNSTISSKVHSTQITKVLKCHTTMTDKDLEQKFLNLKNKELKNPPNIEDLNRKLQRSNTEVK